MSIEKYQPVSDSPISVGLSKTIYAGLIGSAEAHAMDRKTFTKLQKFVTLTYGMCS